MVNKYEEIANRSKASQDKRELARLLEIVDTIHPENILEVGVHLGRSIETWIEAFHPSNIVGLEKDTCYSYDHIPGATIFKGVDSHSEETKRAVENFFQFTDGVDIMQLDIDFLFIDGDHMYDGVKRDFELYSPLVDAGGIIALHDISITDNPTVEVYRFWAELKQKYKTEEIYFGAPGTGTGIVWL